MIDVVLYALALLIASSRSASALRPGTFRFLRSPGSAAIRQDIIGTTEVYTQVMYFNLRMRLHPSRTGSFSAKALRREAGTVGISTCTSIFGGRTYYSPDVFT